VEVKMKYPELWEKAKKISKKVKTELIPTLPIKNNNHLNLISRAVSGGAFNNSITMMAYTELQNGLTEEEIYDLCVSRVRAHYIFVKEKSNVKTKKQKDLEFYLKTQKALGNIN
jgi:hypothetical protein